eukprot:scaffold4681_cov36-Phaeocystis_antarctica.AAC.1
MPCAAKLSSGCSVPTCGEWSQRRDHSAQDGAGLGWMVLGVRVREEKERKEGGFVHAEGYTRLVSGLSAHR